MSTTNLAAFGWPGARCYSYRTFTRKLVDFALGKSEFAQELACIGTKRRRRRSRFRIAARQAETASHDVDRTIAAGHGAEALEQSPLEHLRMLEHGG